MAHRQKPNGAILYRGPSMLTRTPIVVVATGLAHASANPKTGDMVQTYILVDGKRGPLDAAKHGDDVAICGDCKHRKTHLGSCYVTLVHGPRSVYAQLKRRKYPRVKPEQLGAIGAGRYVRLGTYGDPMAVPAWVWTKLLAQAAGHTGYTHQWQGTDHGAYQIDPTHQAAVSALVMASVDSCGEAAAARAQGQRYFRVRQADEPLGANEIMCPASAEANYRRTCQTCGACKGGNVSRTSIAIVVHGTTSKRFTLTAVA